MQIFPLYPTLIYCGNASSTYYNSIQKDFKNTLTTLKSQNKLNQKRIGEHFVSDITFGGNLVKEFNLLDFQREALTHSVQYMQLIGRDTVDNNFEISESWMTVSKLNNHTPRHEHGAADISGVYYINVEDDDSEIYFSTPVKQCQSSKLFSATHPDVSMKPTNGMFILFPGWLEHGVSIQKIDSERVSVAFNIKVTKL